MRFHGKVCDFSVKPFIVKAPKDTTAISGSSLVLECEIDGDPAPNILWRKTSANNMPSGKIIEGKGLRLERIASADEGVYICEGDNQAGSVSASATLTVFCK